MTIKEVAAMHGCHHATVRKAIAKRKLKATKSYPHGSGGSYFWYIAPLSAERWKPGRNTGRPPKRAEERREYSLQVAITGAERAILARDARRGETLPDVARRRMFEEVP